MTNDSRNLAARCGMLLARHIEQIRRELERDPACARLESDPMVVGLILVLCNTVMDDENWERRDALFREFAGCNWPRGATVRRRIEQLLDGLNLDGWRNN